jgi:hypothetical protein
MASRHPVVGRRRAVAGAPPVAGGRLRRRRLESASVRPVTGGGVDLLRGDHFARIAALLEVRRRDGELAGVIQLCKHCMPAGAVSDWAAARPERTGGFRNGVSGEQATWQWRVSLTIRRPFSGRGVYQQESSSIRRYHIARSTPHYGS